MLGTKHNPIHVNSLDDLIIIPYDIKKGESFWICVDAWAKINGKEYGNVPIDPAQETIANMKAALEIAYAYIKEDECVCDEGHSLMCARCRIIRIMQKAAKGK